MTVLQKKAHNPIAHLTPEDIEQLGVELDAIRPVGHRHPRRRRRGVHPQGHRPPSASSSSAAAPCCSSRCSRRPGSSARPASSVAKIIENMEIGHNVMHGQWDWMRDPKIHSTTWEWDNASPSEQWKHSHNELHHTYTNVIGKDNDLGYGIMRVDEDQRWVPLYLAPAAVELHQRLLLRVRHRGLRPRARQEPRDKKRRRTPTFKAPRAR